MKGRSRNEWRASGRAVALAAMVSGFALVRCGGESTSRSHEADSAGAPSGGDASAGSAGTGEGGTSAGTGGVTAGTVGAAGTGGITAGTGGVTVGTGGTDGGAGAGCPGFDPTATLEMSLDAYCDSFGCTASFDEATRSEQDRCMLSTNQVGLTLRRGCGYAILGFDFGFSNQWEVFDTKTGELVGASRFTDAQPGPCLASAYRAGVEFPECSTIWTCATCPTEPPHPLCRYDCDCETTDLNGDPCINEQSCGCYCRNLRLTPP